MEGKAEHMFQEEDSYEKARRRFLSLVEDGNGTAQERFSAMQIAAEENNLSARNLGEWIAEEAKKKQEEKKKVLDEKELAQAAGRGIFKNSWEKKPARKPWFKD